MLTGLNNIGNRINSPDYAQESGSQRILAAVHGNENYAGQLYAKTWQEYQIEQGNYFRYTGFQDLQVGSEHIIQFRPGQESHMVFSVWGELDFDVVLYEGTSYDVDSGGTQIHSDSLINWNRSSSNVAVNSMRVNPVVTVSGEDIFNRSSTAELISMNWADKFMPSSGTEYTLRIISAVDSNYVEWDMRLIEP